MVNINISNKLFYSLIAVIAIIIVGIGVYAYGTSNPSAFGHSGDEINVVVGGATKTLNQALTDLSSGGAGSSGCTMIAESPLAASTLSVAVPASCKNSNGCYIVMVFYTSTGAVKYVRSTTYSQFEVGTGGYWGTDSSTGNDFVNGDSTASNIIYITGLNLQDDKSGTETDKEHWTLYDSSAAYSSKVYVCS